VQCSAVQCSGPWGPSPSPGAPLWAIMGSGSTVYGLQVYLEVGETSNSLQIELTGINC
jgi:hypothetical protein